MRLPGPLLGFILTMVWLQVCSAGKRCKDTSNVCRKIGRGRSASRCYRKHVANQCCATCRRLRDITWPGCEYGDTQDWCSSIGDRYALSSCYENEDICCRTCPRLRLHITGCPYGDRVLWCQHIGEFYSPAQCQGHGNDTCCETCHRLFIQHHTNVSVPVGIEGEVDVGITPTSSHNTSSTNAASDVILPNISRTTPTSAPGRVTPHLIVGPLTNHTGMIQKSWEQTHASSVNNSRTASEMDVMSTLESLGINNITVALDSKTSEWTDDDANDTDISIHLNMTASPGTQPAGVYNHIDDALDSHPGEGSIDIDNILQWNSSHTVHAPSVYGVHSREDEELEDGTTDDEDYLTEGSGDDYYGYEIYDEDYDNEARYHRNHHKSQHRNRQNESGFKLKGWPNGDSKSDYMYYDLHSGVSTSSRHLPTVLITAILTALRTQYH